MAEINSIDRLQFRHHSEAVTGTSYENPIPQDENGVITGETIEEARANAIAYISGTTDGQLVKYSMWAQAEEGCSNPFGHSLYGEPTVVKYRAANSSDVHLLFAIGMETNDSDYADKNMFCIIDIDKTEQEIADLWEALEKAIKALTLNVLDTDTLDLELSSGDTGVTLSGDVKTAKYHIWDDITRYNTIMVGSGDTAGPQGLFVYVNLDYDKEHEKFTFTKSLYDGTLQSTEVELPNNYVIGGVYDFKTEDIVLKMKNGDEVRINCEHLIYEWDVAPSGSTPIVLKRERVKYNPLPHHRHSDILSADIVIDGSRPYNILKRNTINSAVYVDGHAKNIAYDWNGKSMTVNDALNDLKNIKISPDRSNIIQDRADGFFANTTLDYISSENKLVFRTTNVDGTIHTNEISLNSVEIPVDMYYDPRTETLVIRWRNSEGKEKKIEIPISDMITEWEVLNPGHNITLDKIRSVGGNDKLCGDVNISDEENNILVDKNHSLYVKGTADNIKYNETTVKDAIDTLNINLTDEIKRAEDSEQALDEKINREIENRIVDVDTEEARAISAETVLNDKIGTGFTDDPHENVTFKFEQLQNKVNEEAEKLQNEIDRSTEKDNEHDERLDEQQAEIEAVSADSKASLKDIINNDHSINVDKTDPVKPVISVNLSEHQPYNTIRLEGDGLYNFIDLRYDSDTNKLTFVRSENGSTENVEKEIQLNSAPFDIRYDKDREVLIITYHTSEGDKTVEIDLHDLIHDEWSVQDTETIELNKSLVVSGGPDVLTAKVKICHHEDNAIEEHNDGIYVHSYSGEIADLGSRINTVSGDVITEKARAEEAESNLANSITTERDRAIVAENGLHDEIEAERRRAEAADTELHNAIQDEKRRAEAKEETLANSIGDEVIRATNAEENLSHLIDDEAERRISGDSTLRNDINSEITRSTNKDNEHDTAISNLEASAHSLSDRILQEAADRDVADASLRELINTEKSDRVAQDTVITERLTNEINRSTAEDDRLNAALEQEIADRVDGDAELEQAIRDATLTFKNTVTAKMNKSARNEVSTDVIVPTDDNIIIVDEGIKAMVKLLYDAATNKLMLEKTTASGHTWDTVQLNAGSIIQSIEYDSHTKELVIKYEKTSEPGVQYETRVNVEDLFNPWLPNNPSEKSAIELGLVYGAGPLGEDLLSARTLITDDRNGDGKPDEGSDNVIEIRNNGLYVSNSAATIAECVSGKTDAMYKAIFGSAMLDGCGENIVYTPDPRSCVLSAATSFAEADSIMGYEICRILDMWTSGLTCSAFAEFVDNPISDKKEIKVDLRSSHGKGNRMTDDDIYITDCDAKIIEPGVSEFTDTNALRIVCLENCGGTLPDLKDNQNGIYLSNVWDCGKYYDRTNPTDMAGHDAVDADGYNANYWVDNDASAIDYSNYLRQ